jgi:hypothetical protein
MLAIDPRNRFPDSVQASVVASRKDVDSADDGSIGIGFSLALNACANESLVSFDYQLKGVSSHVCNLLPAGLPCFLVLSSQLAFEVHMPPPASYAT